ncbi:glutamyl-tRNA reductase [Thermosipho melanesiensis]|uniref:Glutamyl-tRNA reductase n=2 Tax=Thermosipho melanesiensis TaxID=46541 RepID=HEM1_THEM4|nr:glutamyl-tRNA reductase [Thermosipho melanesiensis]A6LKW9.1 RecName: Full=Glutamyl-tRNA reductase; Short=GluTR [Thermosipho melanesiensis BI429]ABR30570.1 Glutamyl-tRNA reductase [Thermosipho melanesiensis BI429]APT73718.1 glutamyl-tRNA reductase [Thermosipho melanesiensis]OOC35656.1 glutamyl-tRNA reductase [Thermosipho melanesiensis]OOC38955.1 glutamyl-tRNA reductase [Thermosipho melanesiensis]OOC39103.1 glutamyl-tRNA reductase [Thermosipho melanesiensis]
MKLNLVGLGRNTPIYILEKFDFDEQEFFSSLKVKTTEVAVLKTCHRREIYYIGDKEPLTINEIIEPYIIRKSGIDVVRHLFKVSCGLDSMVLGEHQILSQVKNTHKNFCHGKILNKLFNEAVSLGKEARTKTGINKYPLSISYIAVKLIEEQINIEGKKIFVIGTGMMGQKVIKYLVSRGADIYISNRTIKKAYEIKKMFSEVNIVDFEEKYKHISSSDVVISATNAPHYVVEEKKVNSQKNIIFIDLSMPRNIEPSIKEYHTLYTLEDLNEISKKYNKLRQEKISTIQNLIETRIKKFLTWYKLQTVKDDILYIQNLAEKLVYEEIEKLSKKILLDDNSLKQIQKSLKSCTKKIVSYHINYIKEKVI